MSSTHAESQWLELSEEKYRLPATYGQRSLWFIHQLNPDCRAYEIPIAVELTGALDTDALIKAITDTVNHHEALRANFFEDDDAVWQVIPESAQPAIPVVACREWNDYEEAIATWLGQRMHLSRSPLFQVKIFKFGDTQHALVLRFHHIIVDHVSTELVAREIEARYASAVNRTEWLATEQGIDYGDYAVWQLENKNLDSISDKLNVWRERITETVGCINLPTDYARPREQSFSGNELRYTLDNDLTDLIRRFSRENRVSVFVTLLTAYAALLQRYTRQEQIFVGVPFANRGEDDSLTNIVGLLINTLPIPCRIDADADFLTNLQEVRSVSTSIQANQDVPLELLIEELPVIRDPAFNPLYQVGFSVQPPPTVLKLTGCESRDLQLHPHASVYDLQVWMLDEADGSLGLQLWYDDAIYTRETVERFSKHYEQLIEHCLSEPSRRLDALELVTAEEVRQLEALNATQADLPGASNFADFVLGSDASKTTAIIAGADELSHDQLRRQVTSLSTAVSDLGLARGDVVGVLLERDIRLIPSLLSVLRSGMTYVPMDSSYPAQLLNHIVTDSGMRALITQRSLADVVEVPEGVTVHFIEDLWVDEPASEWSPCVQDDRDRTAYVIYTSGSTGLPKGVRIPHSALMNLMSSLSQTPGLGSTDRLLALASHSFDMSVPELYAPLCVGGSLVLGVREEAANAEAIVDLIDRHSINVLQITATTGRLLLESGWRPKATDTIWYGAEPLTPDVVETTLACTDRVWNLYGPTETTVWSTVAKVTAAEAIDIGRPMANTQVYVLDEQLHRLPIGVPGELYIGGAGVAQGYLNRAELTAERFIEDPFPSEQRAGQTLYRTGDLVRMDAAGRLHHLGRLDHQVKVRGFRVELGQIEAALLEHDAVDDVVVHAKEIASGDQRLVAYTVMEAMTAATANELRDHLKERLPEYMVPQFFVVLEALPRTPNGKVDRQALPEPADGDTGLEYEAPVGEVEETIAGIWSELIGIDRVGRHDNFFAIGGHSLLLTRVANRVQKELEQSIPLRNLFEDPTISSWSALFGQPSDNAAAIPPLEVIDLDRYKQGGQLRVPATASQRALWFIHQANPEQHAYDIPIAFELKGTLDVPRLAQAVKNLIARHATLRSHMSDDGAQLWQWIQPSSDQELVVIDVADEVALRTAVNNWLMSPMNPATGPLFDAYLFRIGGEHAVLGLRAHHIISDQQTLMNIAQELSTSYTGADLPDLSVDFPDYAVWSESYRTDTYLSTQLEPWQSRIQEPVSCIDLPTDFPRPKRQTFSGQPFYFEIPDRLTHVIRDYSRDQGTTVFTTLLTAYAILLEQYSRQSQVMVGVPFSNRALDERLQDVIGLFINTLPVPCTVDSTKPFVGVLQDIGAMLQSVQGSQDVPLEAIMEAVPVVRDPAYNPLFQVGFSLQPKPAPITLDGVETQPYPALPDAASYDMHWWVLEDGDRLEVDILYDDTLYRGETIGRFVTHFLAILEHCLSEPSRRLDALELITAEEVRQLEALNATQADLPGASNFADFVLGSDASKTTAIIAGADELSHDQLRRQVTSLSTAVSDLGLARGDVVGVLLERDIRLIPSLLSVLRSGMTYVPMDSSYPAQLLNHIVTDSGMRALITQRSLADVVEVPEGVTVHFIEDLWVDEPASEWSPCVQDDRDRTAYVIYTSGSTGLPKGVRIPHSALMNLMSSLSQTPGLGSTDRLLALASHSFDMSVPELYAPLCVGGSLVLGVREEAANAEAIVDLIDRHSINVLQITATTGRLLLESGWRPKATDTIWYGAEPLTPDVVETTLACTDRVWNLYGPTETTVWSTVAKVTAAEAIDIGRPMANTQVYVLDEQLHRLPIGVPGELYIGGAGVAQGYLNRAELTAERFIEDPFPSEQRAGQTLYRTGDLVRMDAAGRLHHLGRLDHQVKVRGFRVELGQIEAALLEHDAVDDVVVHAKEIASGDQRLVAYTVMEAMTAATANELRDHLKERLPEYMVPQFFVVLEALPRTPNGKVDRQALPEPADGDTGLEYEAPVGEVEETIAGIWSELIGIDRVGRHDNFFAIGGHSLLLTRVANRVQKELEIDLPMRDLLEDPTVADWAKRFAETSQTATLPVITSYDRHDYIVDGQLRIPATASQNALWFIQQANPEQHAYEIAAATEIRGHLDVARLHAALQLVLARHDALRTTLEDDGVQLWQRIHEDVQVDFEIVDVPGESRLGIAVDKWLATSIDLRSGPLFEARLYRVNDERAVLGLRVHHIVADQQTMLNILTDVDAAYVNERLDDTALSFGDYSVWTTQHKTPEYFASRLYPWTDHIDEPVGCIDLPTDFPRPRQQSFSGKRHTTSLPDALAAQASRYSQAHNITVFATLLSTYGILLQRYTRQADLMIGVPFTNRTADERLQDVVGLFINTLPVPCHVDSSLSFDAVTQVTRQRLNAVQAEHDMPLEAIMEAVPVIRDPAYNPFFQVGFSLQPKPDVLRLGDLDTRVYDIFSHSSSYDMHWWVLQDDAGGLDLEIWYDDHLFTPETIGRFVTHFLAILEHCLSEPSRRLDALELVTAEEVRQLEALNATQADLPGAANFADFVLGSDASKTTAIIAGADELSHDQLRRQVSSLSTAVSDLGLARGDVVGVLLERDIRLIPSLLSVLRSGMTYVPMDSSYPAQLLNHIVTDSGMRALITQRSLADVVEVPEGVTVHFIEDLWVDEPASEWSPCAQDDRDRTAYVIYTSGSTGLPKGVRIPHSALMNLMSSLSQTPGLGSTDRLLALASHSFDMSVPELYAPLCVGGSLVLGVREEAANAEAIVDLIDRHSINVLQITATTGRLLLESGWRPKATDTIWYGAEPLTPDVVETTLACTDRVWNLYGPTETTVWSTVAKVTAAEAIDIGRPMANTQVYVLDEQLHRLPIGVPGELYIGGAGVAQGYLNRAELTAERFIEHPFPSEQRAGQTLYRTGDLVRMDAAGRLHHLGRLDHQVKVRGFRVELGQIEAALLEHDAVGDVVVHAKEIASGDQRLAAYVVTQTGTGELRDHLKQLLPDYMVPQFFVTLEALPRTPNGKIDRHALPEPTDGESGLEYEAPVGEVEETIAGIWSELIGVDRVGRHDNFFAIGGHSLLLTRVANKVKQALDADMTLKDLLEDPTPIAWATLASAADSSTLPAIQVIQRDEYKDGDAIKVPATASQRALWFIQQANPAQQAYEMPAAVAVRGPLDIDRLTHAIELVIARHDALRTTLFDDGDTLWQIVHAPCAFDLEITDHTRAALQQDVQRWLAQTMDLINGPLFQARVFRVDSSEHVLILRMHHIVSDKQTMENVFRDVNTLYCEDRLEPLELGFVDYAVWAETYKTPEYLAGKLTPWTEHIQEPVGCIALPTDLPRPKVQSFSGGRLTTPLTEECSRRVQSYSRANAVTPFTTLLSGFALLMERYTRQSDLLIGVPFTNRSADERLEGAAGLFINTLPVPCSVDARQSFEAVTATTRQRLNAVQAEHDVPLEMIMEAVPVIRDPAYNPLFQVGFSLQSKPDVLQLGDLETSVYDVFNNASSYDMHWWLFEDDEGGLEIEIWYDDQLFESATLQRLVRHFEQLLQSCLDAPGAVVGDHALLTAAEERQFEAWNDTERPEVQTDNLAGLVVDRLSQRIETPVVISGEHSLTGSDIVAMSAQVAARLRAEGVTSGDRVGVMLERRVDLLPTLLGVMQVGAAYVPLDPAYPADLLNYIADDAELKCIVLHNSVAAEKPGSAPGVVVDEIWSDSADALDVIVDVGDTAYVIYTSGSTGRPKGVQIGHRAAVNLLMTMIEDRPGLTAEDVFLAVTTLSFDISVLELFGPLLAGAQLVIASRDEAMDGEALIALQDTHRVTAMQATPSSWRLLLEAGWAPQSNFKVWCGGEPLPNDLAAALLAHKVELWNMYGPTETTVWSTVSRVASAESIDIGQPIANTEVYVLDEQLHRLPIGVPGELFIGGAGLAHGYLHRPELTAERFIAHPFKSDDERLYRTGDLVCLRSDGTLQHLGRLDHQVKVRGFRVELGQIEAALLEHDTVDDVVVHAKEIASGDQRLVAYVVTQTGTGELRDHLKQLLPDYMVPQFFVTLDALPRTPNGKVDRHALPEPTDGESGLEYEAPVGEVEETIAGIWSEAIGIERVGRHDNFFAIGGHSLLLTRVANKVQLELGVNVGLKDFLAAPTVADWASCVRAADKVSNDMQTPIARIERGRSNELTVPATYAQRAMWYVTQANPTINAFNVAGAINISGTLDCDKFAAAFEAVINRHDVLKAAFAEMDGQVMQVVQTQRHITLGRSSLSGSSSQQIQAWVDAPFDIAAGPLARGQLFDLGDQYVLALCLHHLVADHTSLVAIVEQLQLAYDALLAEKDIEFAAMEIDYLDYAAWQRANVTRDVMQSHLDPWTERIVEPLGCLNLPTDRPRPKQQSFDGERHRQSLSRDLCEQIRAFSSHHRVTPFSTFLSAYVVLLQRYAHQEDIVVGVPFHNRSDDERLEAAVGLFANVLPIPCSVDADKTFLEIVAGTRQVLLDVQGYQDMPLEMIMDAVPAVRDASFNPLFQTTLSMQSLPPKLLLPGCEVTNRVLDVVGSPLDLQVWIIEEGDLYDVEIWYNTELFDASTIARLTTHLQSMLKRCVAAPDEAVLNHSIISDAEVVQFDAWNETSAEDVAHDNLAGFVMDRLLAAPDKIALEDGNGHSLSNQAIVERSNQVAARLREQGVTKGHHVGVLLRRSVDVLPTLLGVLQTGAAYIPMDPDYPSDLLDYIARDAGLEWVLAHEDIAGDMPGEAKPIVVEQIWSAADVPQAVIEPAADLAAYVIYTSGSTGRPKGVEVSHAAALNLLVSMVEEPGLQSTDKFLAVTTLSFDISLLELFGPLIAGSKLFVATRNQAMDGYALLDVHARHGITAMQATPSSWRLMLDAGWQPPAAFKVWCGGEPLPKDLADELLSHGVELWNLYGPTETTVWSTASQIVDAEQIDIGVPIRNTQLYVLDEGMNRLPIGVPGELFIGGTGVARGYLNRPDLTRERFIESPFDADERIYKTGDLVRVMADGRLQHLGRLDHQVKIRGFRVELGQIEATLLEHEVIADAVVHAKQIKVGDQRLIAYVVAQAQAHLTASDLRSFLRDQLPDYMVPQFFMILDAIPRTPNGKVDRHALPQPSDLDFAGEYVAPEGPLEETIAAVWQNMIGIKRVSRHDNFFAIGGHSLLAIKTMAQITEATGKPVGLQDLLALSLDEIASRLESLESTGAASNEAAPSLWWKIKRLLGSLIQR